MPSTFCIDAWVQRPHKCVRVLCLCVASRHTHIPVSHCKGKMDGPSYTISTLRMLSTLSQDSSLLTPRPASCLPLDTLSSAGKHLCPSSIPTCSNILISRLLGHCQWLCITDTHGRDPSPVLVVPSQCLLCLASRRPAIVL